MVSGRTRSWLTFTPSRLHEKAEGAEFAARQIRQAVERLTGWISKSKS
jgi:hypothetical protein